MAVTGGFPRFAPELADTVSGADPDHFPFLAAAEQDHFWFVPRARLISRLIGRYFPRADSLLEIGCGTGLVLSRLAGDRRWRRLAGSELHPSALGYARERLSGRAELVQMDARRIPAAAAFDVIGAFDVLEHIEEDRDVLRAMHRAARPGGGIAIAVPQHPWLWSAADDLGHHVRRYRRGELEAKVEEAGFRVLFSGSYNFVLLPLLAFSRGRERFVRGREAASAGLAAVQAEFVVPRALNSLLKALLQVEVGATLRGMRFPAGGSRLVLAEKQDGRGEKS